MPINGQYYGWEDLTAAGPTGPMADIQAVDHNWDRDLELVYGQGTAPRGVGRGNIKFEGTLTLLREEYNRLLLFAAAAGKSLTRLAPFTITLAYMNEDQGVSTDQLLRCRFKSGKKAAKQGDKTSTVELAFLFEGLKENGVDMVAGMNLF
jgi:hypothetical protein